MFGRKNPRKPAAASPMTAYMEERAADEAARIERVRKANEEASVAYEAFKLQIAGDPKYSLETIISDHAVDLETYSLKGTRIAEFLILEIKRFVGLGPTGERVFRSENTCINLASVSRIDLRIGEPIKEEASFELVYQDYMPEGENVDILHYSHYPRALFGRDFGFEIPSGYLSRRNRADYGNIELPVPPLSGYINFEGVDVILRPPYGMETQIRDQILEVIHAGYTPRPITIQTS